MDAITELTQTLEQKEVLKLWNRRPDAQRKQWTDWVEDATGPATRRRRIESITLQLNQGDFTVTAE